MCILAWCCPDKKGKFYFFMFSMHLAYVQFQSVLRDRVFPNCFWLFGPFVLPGFSISPPRKRGKSPIFLAVRRRSRSNSCTRIFWIKKISSLGLLRSWEAERRGKKKSLSPLCPGSLTLKANKKYFSPLYLLLAPPQGMWISWTNNTSLPFQDGRARKMSEKSIFFKKMKSNICMNPWPDHLEGKEEEGKYQ